MLGIPCPFCHRQITQAVLDKKRMLKTDNARASTKKRIANGTYAGPPKLRDDSWIKELRRQGLTIREIAKEIGLSTSAVQRGLK